MPKKHTPDRPPANERSWDIQRGRLLIDQLDDDQAREVAKILLGMLPAVTVRSCADALAEALRERTRREQALSPAMPHHVALRLHQPARR